MRALILLYWRDCCNEAAATAKSMSARRQLKYSMKIGLWILLASTVLFSACARRMLPPRPYLAFIADHGANGVAVFNLARFDITKQIPLGFSPTRLAARPHSSEIYVTSDAGQIAVIRFPGLAVERSARFGAGPVQALFTPDGGTAFIFEMRSGILVKVDCRSGAMLGQFRLPAPVSTITLTPDGKMALAGGGGKLFLINAETGEALKSIETGPGESSIVALPGGQKAFVALSGNDEVAAIDLASRQMLSRIEVGSPPSLLALKPDGGEVFAFSAADSTLTILDAFHDSVEQSMTAGAGPAAAVFTRDSRLLFIANAGSGSVTEMDVATRAVKALVHSGSRPSSLALTPDGRFLAVTDPVDQSISVIRTATGDLITTKPAGQDPLEVVIPGWQEK